MPILTATNIAHSFGHRKILDGVSLSIEPGQRIAQLVLAKVEMLSIREADELPSTTRAAGGFGSTGK